MAAAKQAAVAIAPVVINSGFIVIRPGLVEGKYTHPNAVQVRGVNMPAQRVARLRRIQIDGFAPIFPDICYHLTHYKPAAADIPVASDNPAHYADAIRYNARTPLQGSLLPLTRLVWA